MGPSFRSMASAAMADLIQVPTSATPQVTRFKGPHGLSLMAFSGL
jgi:hypothetical protein